MYKLPSLVLAGAFLSSVAHAAAPTSAEGLWRTPAYNGEVLIFACGQALCGKIVTSDRIKTEPGLADTKNRNPALRTRPLKDLVMLEGFTGGPPEWKGGKVYNPEDGGTYKGTIRLVDADTLRLKGCIIAPLCKTQTWRRIQ